MMKVCNFESTAWSCKLCILVFLRCFGNAVSTASTAIAAQPDSQQHQQQQQQQHVSMFIWTTLGFEPRTCHFEAPPQICTGTVSWYICVLMPHSRYVPGQYRGTYVFRCSSAWPWVSCWVPVGPLAPLSGRRAGGQVASIGQVGERAAGGG